MEILKKHSQNAQMASKMSSNHAAAQSSTLCAAIFAFPAFTYFAYPFYPMHQCWDYVMTD